MNTFHLTAKKADNFSIGFFRYSLYPHEGFTFVNQPIVKMLGYSSKPQFKKVKFQSIFCEQKDKDKFLSLIRKDGKVNLFEVLLKNKTGSSAWAAITGCRIVFRGKEHIEGIIEDISVRKSYEERLAYEKDYLQGLLDYMPDAIYFKDKSNRIIKVNRFYLQGMNIPEEKIIGRTDFDFFPQAQAEKMFEDDNYVLRTGKPLIGKIERTLLPSGTWNQVITTKIPMRSKNGEIIGTMGMTRDMTAYANMEQERVSMLINTVGVLGKALEQRDPYTYNHTRSVADISEKIGRVLGYDENKLLSIRLAGELHDIGKMSIPLDILNKPGKLTDLEYRFVQEHVKNCYEMIKDVKFPLSLADIIYQHHERLDGTGYPRKLKGEQILPESRILAISDVLESMTCLRPYREALGIDKAQEELKMGSGIKYDANVVDVVNDLISQNNGKPFWPCG